MDEKNEGRSIEKVVGKIEFRDVWFRYPTRKEEFVLKGLCLTIKPGESVALVGESGCGKSTFVNLMMRFYDPDHGKILLDDVDLKEYNLHELRKAISLVMQEPIIFNYSILENVLYSKLDATNEEIKHVCEMAYCNDFIIDQFNREKETNVDVEDATAKELIAKMEQFEKMIVNDGGETQEKFNEWKATMTKIHEAEESKGKFKYKEGDIDTRTEAECGDLLLHEGFSKTICGLKGSKLSGG